MGSVGRSKKKDTTQQKSFTRKTIKHKKERNTDKETQLKTLKNVNCFCRSPTKAFVPLIPSPIQSCSKASTHLAIHRLHRLLPCGVGYALTSLPGGPGLS